MHDDASGLDGYIANLPETSLDSILQTPHGIDIIDGNALIKKACICRKTDCPFALKFSVTSSPISVL